MTGLRQIDGFDILGSIHNDSVFSLKLAHSHTGIPRRVALKILKASPDGVFPSCHSEFISRGNTAMRLHHDNIARVSKLSPRATYFSKSGEVHQVAYVAEEFCPGGSLFDFLAFSGGLTEAQIRTVFVSVLKGLRHAEREGVAHGGLKPESLLFASDFKIKISGFGWDRASPSCKPLTMAAAYCPPEAHSSTHFDPFQADIFSLGVLLYSLLFAAPPFATASSSDKQYRLFRQNKSIFWQQRKGRYVTPSHQFTWLIDHMLEENPKLRPSLQQLWENFWVSGELDTVTIATTVEMMFADVNSGMHRKRAEGIKRRRVRSAGTDFKGDSSDSDISEGEEIKPKEIRPFHPCRNSYFRLSVLFTAEQTAYILRTLLRNRSGYRVNERVERFVFDIEYEGAGREEIAARVELLDAEGDVVLEMRKLRGCFFRFWTFFLLVKTEMDYSESLFSL